MSAAISISQFLADNVSDIGSAAALSAGVFRIDFAGGTSRFADAAEIAAAQAAFDVETAEQTLNRTERADLKGQFDTAVNRLAQISNAASPTNAQVIQAVRDLATYQLKILKYIRKL